MKGDKNRAIATATVTTKEKKSKGLNQNKKKTIILISMIVLLVTVGCLNYFLNFPPKAEEDPTAPTFFATFRIDREATRAQEILYLDGIIASELSTPDAIDAAQEKKINLCDTMEKELVLEGLIKAQGFEDCIVTMSTENVNIVVKTENLGLEQAAQILSIIVNETDYTAPDVILIPYV
ncbi:MAG: SpoIIIAH-like family protein [Christensenellales bacterium]|jgi:hypothetical protein